nr:zinc finger BED domain-containing protein RICESLEEPER 3 [Tanacetum cinerariifolium]
MSRDGSIFVYNPDVLHEQFAGLVIQRGLPFNHFNDEQTTRVFQNHPQQKYNTRVIAFEDFLVPHMGGALARVLTKVFVSFNLEDKFMSITLDNASNNTSAIEARKPCLSHNWDIPIRWNSTYHMFQCGLKQRSALMYFYDLLASKAKKSIFHVLSRMTMDIISVQATLVASESAFSTSERVLSIQRTRLTLASLEMFMCLNDHLDAQERKQDKFNPKNPVDFEEEILDADVQQNEAIPLTDEEIALDATSSECTMFDSGSAGENVDYDMTTNYGDDYYLSIIMLYFQFQFRCLILYFLSDVFRFRCIRFSIK